MILQFRSMIAFESFICSVIGSTSLWFMQLFQLRLRSSTILKNAYLFFYYLKIMLQS